MKLVAREDIAAPIDEVFRAVSDFDAFERAALRRGAEVARTDALGGVQPGMAWQATFPFRGRQRSATARLEQIEPPTDMRVVTLVAGMEIEMTAELVALSRSQTRLNLAMELRPRSIPAKLMVQSLKLARTNILKRYRKAVAGFAQRIERRQSPRFV